MEAVETSKSCPNCNANIRQNALFCHKCGFSFDIIKETGTAKKNSIEEDVKKSFSEWFTPTVETRELDEKSLTSSDKISSEEIGEINDYPNVARLLNEKREKAAKETELKMNQAETAAKTGEIKTDDTDGNNETVPLDIAEDDIKRRVAEIKSANEFTPAEVASLKEVAVEEHLSEPEKVNEIVTEKEVEESVTAKKTPRPTPPRRQISKTREYIWEDSQNETTPVFFLVAIAALVTFAAIFWLSGFLKL